MNSIDLLHPVWAEININNFIHNIQVVKDLIPNDVKLLAVIKANAYGHGATKLGKIAHDSGVDMLAVSSIKEAMSLRSSIIDDVKILVLGYTCDNLADIAIINDIRLCVYTKQFAISLSKMAVLHNKIARIHIKIDTGMGRIGYRCLDSSLTEIEDISKLPNIVIEGIFTHFASADEDNYYTNVQMQIYLDFICKLSNIGINPIILHCANSAALVSHQNTHMSMVRAGIILYGLQPLQNKIIDGIKPVMSLKAKIINIKYVNSGDSISYGRSFIADSNRKIATLPIGYADGYMRSLSNKAEVLVKGRRVPVVGSICMDQCMIDVSHIEDVDVGDEVVLFGRDSFGNEITADELANILNTINYEIVTAVSNRVTRIFVQDNKYSIE